MMKRRGWLAAPLQHDLVNVGKGDFVLRATRDGEGAPGPSSRTSRTRRAVRRSSRLASQLVWGGDGHDHWHVQRVAINRLVPLDSNGRPVANGQEWPDAKVGFCFYDFSLWLDTGPADNVYSHESCGSDATTTRSGWGSPSAGATHTPARSPGSSST